MGRVHFHMLVGLVDPPYATQSTERNVNLEGADIVTDVRPGIGTVEDCRFDADFLVDDANILYFGDVEERIKLFA